MKQSDKLSLEITFVEAFLYVQLECMKTKFSEHGNNKDLQTMTDLNRTKELIKDLKENLVYLSTEIRKLRQENNQLKQGL